MTVPRPRRFPERRRGARWTEESGDAGIGPTTEAIKGPPEPRVRPRSALGKAAAAVAGVEQARRRSRERAAAAREQREAMEREAQLRRRRPSGETGGHRRAQRARETARRRAPRRPRRARRRAKSTPRLAKTPARPASARHPQRRRGPRTKTRGSPSCATSRRRDSKRRALAHEKLRKELDRHKKEGTSLKGLPTSDATRMPCLPWIGSHRSRVEPRACVLLLRMMWTSGPCKGRPFVVRHDGPKIYRLGLARRHAAPVARLDMGAADGAPCGFAALDAVDSVRVRHRKGVPVIWVKEPGRALWNCARAPLGATGFDFDASGARGAGRF